MLIGSCKRCSEYGTKKIIDINILALNRVYFPNYCLIIKTSISLKVRNIGFCQFATVKKHKSYQKNMKAHMIRKMSEIIQKQRNQHLNIQTEEVLQRCSYKKFCEICWKFTGGHLCQSVIFLQIQSNFIEITLLLGCSFVNLLHIFRTVSYKNALLELLLNILTNKRQKGDIKIQCTPFLLCKHNDHKHIQAEIS